MKTEANAKQKKWCGELSTVLRKCIWMFVHCLNPFWFGDGVLVGPWVVTIICRCASCNGTVKQPVLRGWSLISWFYSVKVLHRTQYSRYSRFCTRVAYFLIPFHPLNPKPRYCWLCYLFLHVCCWKRDWNAISQIALLKKYIHNNRILTDTTSLTCLLGLMKIHGCLTDLKSQNAVFCQFISAGQWPAVPAAIWFYAQA